MKGREHRDVRLYEHGGKAQSLRAWSVELSIPLPTLKYRRRKGWSVGRMLGTPSR